MKKWLNMILMITLMFLLVGSVSALDFGIDNYDKFIEDDNYGIIEIWDTGQTILFQPDDKKLVEYKLIENTDQCLINCYAEGTATLYTNGKLFSDLKFKDGRGRATNLEENKILIWNTYEVEVGVNDYKEVCEDVFNETNQGKACTNKIVGTHKEMRLREAWTEYNFESLDAGDYRWRIEGTKDLGQSIDWIGTSFGKELTDWAWWNGDWAKKKAVNINTILLEKNHTSVLINVSYDSDMENDFDDLRFVDGTETTEIGYWFYNNSYRDSNSVQVWLNTGNLSSSENRTYYMYYENAGASTTSNIDDAFWFADDFNGTAVDFTNKWQSTLESNYSVSNGILTGKDLADSGALIETQDEFASEYVTESRIASINAGLIVYNMWSSPNASLFSGHEYMSIATDQFDILFSTSSLGGSPLDNIYYRSRGEIKTNPCIGNVSSDTLVNLHDFEENCFYEGRGFVGFFGWTTDIKVDWVYVRRYMSTEPTYTFGGEETSLGLFVTQSFPEDYFNATDITVDFGCNFSTTGEENITDVTILVYDNGDNLDYTNTESGLILVNYNKTWLNVALDDDTYNWACYGIGDTTEDYAGNRTLTINTTPAIQFEDPTFINNYNSSASSFIMNVSLTETYFQNITFNIYNSSADLIESHTLLTSVRDYNYTTTYDDTYNYSVSTSTSTSKYNTTETRRINIDTTVPIINVTYPIDYVNYQILGKNLTLNWTTTDSHLESCWYNYNSTNISLTCSTNSTQFNITSYSNRNLTFYANDSFGNENSSFISWNYKLFENSKTYNTSAYETDIEAFSINFTSVGLQTITANFYHGGVDKGAGTKTGDNNEMTFTKSIDIPVSIGNKTIYWKISYGAETIDSPNINQTVNPIFLTYCNASNNITFLNFTFKDETDNSILNASNDLTDFSAFWLGEGSVTKSYTASNSPENSSYPFCFSPAYRTVTTDLIFKYSSTGYPLRTFSYDNYALTNVTTNQTLYLLASASGIYVTFQVLSQAEQPIGNVYALANRTISGTSVLVGSGYTGEDGGVTFWLNPDYEHNFLFSKTGYTTTTATLTPSQPTYTIYMGTGVAAENVSDYSRGIRYTIDPGEYTLNQSSSYSFNYNLTSSYWDLDSFGFTLENASGYNLGSSSSVSGSGGNLSVILDTGTNKTIVMEYYWIIDGDSTNFTRSWYLINASGTQWSIKTFFDDLRTYTDEGMFGLTEFGRTILIFLFIFISVGLVSYYSGMYSPAAILTMVFALVAFFDFGLNMVPNPVRAISHFPTFFIALLAIGVWINEWRK